MDRREVLARFGNIIRKVAPEGTQCGPDDLYDLATAEALATKLNADLGGLRRPTARPRAFFPLFGHSSAADKGAHVVVDETDRSVWWVSLRGRGPVVLPVARSVDAFLDACDGVFEQAAVDKETLDEMDWDDLWLSHGLFVDVDAALGGDDARAAWLAELDASENDGRDGALDAAATASADRFAEALGGRGAWSFTPSSADEYAAFEHSAGTVFPQAFAALYLRVANGQPHSGRWFAPDPRRIVDDWIFLSLDDIVAQKAELSNLPDVHPHWRSDLFPFLADSFGVIAIEGDAAKRTSGRVWSYLWREAPVLVADDFAQWLDAVVQTLQAQRTNPDAWRLGRSPVMDHVEAKLRAARQ